MNWESKPIIKGKEEVTEVNPEMLQKIKSDEEKAEQERVAAMRRKENFERRKIAKEKGIPFVSVEEEERQKLETELVQEENEPEFITREDRSFKPVGTINLAAFEKKDEQKEETRMTLIERFSEEEIERMYQEALLITGDKDIDDTYIQEYIESFIHLYSMDEIEADLERAKNKVERISHSDSHERKILKKMATILETILIEGVDTYKWFGEKIKIIPPSKYDELYNGVDAIIELSHSENENDFLALGIDVSYRSVEGELFEEKINNLLGDIENTHLTQLKYFLDNTGSPIENLYVPKIVLSVDGKTTEDLIGLWQNRIENSEALQGHLVSIDVIGQIAEQCKLFSAYARTVGAEAVSESYDEAFGLLLKISEEVPQAKDALVQFESNKYVNKIESLIAKRRKSVTLGNVA